MKWDPLPWLLMLVLLLLGGVALLTQFPESAVLDRLAEWPGIGPAAERFREIYRPPPPRPGGEAAETEVIVIGRELVGAPPAVSPGPLGTVWLRAGTELRAVPEAGGEVVETLPGIRTMTLLERRGDWRRVARVGLQGGSTEGWVRRDDLGRPTEDELWQPEPVLPLAAAAPPAEILATARELMVGGRELPCGPFLLVTDAGGPLAGRCPRLAGQLERIYAERTGLTPVGAPAEAILLFAHDGAFLIFRTQVSPESRRHAFAAPARGFVALAAGGRPVEQIQATLVHELVHLLNRRYLGPALPSWLDEGLAEELAMSRIGADGTLVPGSLGSWEAGGGESVRLLGGGQVALDGLLTGMRRGELPTVERLVGLDRAAFQAERAYPAHYALSAFWVRYLLSGESPAGTEGFRAFLAAVARGEPLRQELLLARLGAGWPELESGFRRWLDAGASGSSSRQAELPSA